MRGTEKQIAWATEIRTNIIKIFDQMLEMIPDIAPSQAAAEAGTKELQARIDRLNAEDVYAGDIISLFKDIRFSGDHEDVFGRIDSVYRISVPHTAGAAALLGRK